MTLKNIIQQFIEITCLPYGQLHSIDVDKHQDESPSKLLSNFLARSKAIEIEFHTINIKISLTVHNTIQV